MKKLMILLFLLLAGCTHNLSDPHSASVSVLFDDQKRMLLPLNTTVLLTMYDEQALNEHMPQFEAAIHQYHKYFDPNHEFEGMTNLYTINQHYGDGEKLILDPILFDAINDAIDLTQLSHGSFNLTIGALSDLYENKFSSLPITNTDPEDADIEAALACIVPQDQLKEVIQLNEDDHSIEFKAYEPCTKKVKLNMGAFAKGIAAQKAYELLAPYKLPFMASCSESSQFLYAPSSYKKTWTWGIREPNTKNLLAAFEKENMVALSTSGDDQQYYYCEKHQVNHHHILDSTLGRSRNTVRAVSVFSENRADVLDALTTILFNIEESDQRIAMVKQFEEAYQITIGYTIVLGNQEKGFQLIMNQTAKDALAVQSEAVTSLYVEE